MKYLMAIAYLYDMCDQMIIFDYSYLLQCKFLQQTKAFWFNYE